jgi:hypothetical protein
MIGETATSTMIAATISTETPPAPAPVEPKAQDADPNVDSTREIGGRDGLEPTRYGDWEKNGRCIDF